MFMKLCFFLFKIFLKIIDDCVVYLINCLSIKIMIVDELVKCIWFFWFIFDYFVVDLYLFCWIIKFGLV